MVTRVVSDLLIQASDLSFADWQKRMNFGGPVSYGDFRVFVPGDHEYQNAIFMGQIKGLNGNQPRMVDLELQVDLPDIIDRGQGTYSGTGLLTVNFARTFNAPPEVNATQKGGTVVAVERISNITNTSFQIEWVNTSNTRVGPITFSWAAKGY